MSSIGRFENLLEQFKSGRKLSISGLGDSLTAGWAVEKGYFDLLIEQLGARYTTSALTFINAGVPGDTAEDGLRRLSRVIEKCPDVMVVEFGINDMYSGVGVTEYSDSIQKIVERCLCEDIVPVLITSCPLLWEDDRQRLLPYYNALKHIGHGHEVPFRDVTDAWLRREALGYNLYLEDGVHPNAQGHAVMADALISLFVS